MTNKYSDTIKTTEGIVGFFDILGYSSFLENNEPEDAAKTVLDLLLKAPDEVRDKMTTIMDNAGSNMDQSSKEAVDNMLKDRMQWLIFSDTILVAMPYEKTDRAILNEIQWKLFFICTIILYRHLFDSGLPIRGAISYGKYLIEKQCFVGRPIIDSYKAGGNIDLAAITLHESAIKEMDSIADSSEKYYKDYSVDYLTPLRSSTSTRQILLYPSLSILLPLDTSDIRQYVACSFWKHRKDISPEVISKLNNTEQYFRYCIMQYPHLFGE